MTVTQADSVTKQMVAMYAQGHTIRRVAAQFGRSYRNTYTVLAAAGVTFRTKGGRSPALFVPADTSPTVPPQPVRIRVRVRAQATPTRQPTDGERRPWKLDAACRNVDPETWYDPAQVTAAKKVCADCPVRERCLTFALDVAEPWGVWGGFSEGDRRRLLRGARPKLCRHCNLEFVPGRAKGRVCPECQPEPEATIVDHRAEITRLAGKGWSDSMIGAAIGFTGDQVKYARRRWKVPAGEVARGELQPCGTPAAVRRHERRGEPVDDLCLEAERRRQADNRSRQRVVTA